MSRERVERVLDGYAAFNRGDLDAAVDGFGEDMDWVVPDILPDPGPFRGPQAIRQFWEMWREQFSEFRIEIEETHDLDEHVLLLARVRGIGRDSGVDVSTPTFPQVWTFRDERIVRMEMFPSEEAAREAIGRDWR